MKANWYIKKQQRIFGQVYNVYVGKWRGKGSAAEVLGARVAERLQMSTLKEGESSKVSFVRLFVFTIGVSNI